MSQVLTMDQKLQLMDMAVRIYLAAVQSSDLDKGVKALYNELSGFVMAPVPRREQPSATG